MLVLSTGSEPVSAVGFSADGWFVNAGIKDGRVVQLSTDGSMNTLVAKERITGPIHSLVISNLEKQEWYAVGWRQFVAFQNQQERKEDFQTHSFQEGQEFTSWVSLSPTILAFGTGSLISPKPGYFRLFDQNQKRYLGASLPEKGGVRSLSAHSLSQTIAWSTGDRQIVVWEITKPDRVRMSFQHTSPALAFSPDGLALAAAMEWNVVLLDWKQKRERVCLKGHKGRVTAVAFTPHGNVLTSSWDGTARLWDASGREIQTLDFQQGRLTCLAVASDGSRAVVGTDRGTIVIWDLV